MLRLLDVSRYQVERADPLDLAKAKAAGYHIANVALTGGRGYVSGAWAGQYLERAWVLGMGRSTYHWLDGRTPGAAQAATNLTRFRGLFGTNLIGFAHFVDVEETGKDGITPPTWAHVRDYVAAMQDGLGRHVSIYSGDWYWKPRAWIGQALTPWLMGQPNDSLAGVEPGPDHTAWTAGWGGWPAFAVLQWAVKPLPGTGNCSLSMIRDHGVWADLTGGDVLMPQADPGNAQPEAWAGPEVTDAVLTELTDLGQRAAMLAAGQPVEWVRPDLGTEIRTRLPEPRMAAEVCAPTIVAEHVDWASLGGTSNGCVGDKDHGTGFHRGANFVPATDYSRRRDPNGADGPFVNWNYACAGDFRHGGKAALRDLGRIVLAQLMAGQWTNIGEFIGQSWPDRPVMYWSRWEGKLREYTGSGHDTWFHISWFRSRVNQNTHIWKSAVTIRDGVDMPITDTDARTFWKCDTIANPRQRGDSTANPETTAFFAVGDMWARIYDVRDQLTSMRNQIDLLGAALRSAIANADDGAAVIAAIQARSDEMKAEFRAAEDAELKRDADNVARLLAALDLIRESGTDPISVDELREALSRVYGQAFHQAVTSAGRGE